MIDINNLKEKYKINQYSRKEKYFPNREGKHWFIKTEGK